MPTYDYGCEGCEYSWEIYHSIHEDPKYKCPECGSENVKKLFNTVPIMRVKGSDVVEKIMADKEGRKRDLDLYKLENDDPYGHMRPEGDKEIVKSKLKKAGTMNHDVNGTYTGKKFYKKY